MTNLFFFLSTVHIVSQKTHKINIYFSLFAMGSVAKMTDIFEKPSMTHVSNLFRKVYFCEFFMR